MPGIVKGDSIREAVEKLRPKKGSGVDSVTLTDERGRGVKFNADGTTEHVE